MGNNKTKKKSSTNAAIKVVEVMCEGIAAYFLMITVMESTSSVVRGIAGFALFWFVTNVSIFFYRYMISTTAKAIVADS